MGTTSALPGFNAPSVGFEQPFAMLEACHERVQRTLALLQRLRAHVLEHGADVPAQQAARDVLRYFDIAAPLHHEDEELHVFPLLLAQGSPDVAALAAAPCVWQPFRCPWPAAQALPAGLVPKGRPRFPRRRCAGRTGP